MTSLVARGEPQVPVFVLMGQIAGIVVLGRESCAIHIAAIEVVAKHGRPRMAQGTGTDGVGAGKAWPRRREWPLR